MVVFSIEEVDEGKNEVVVESGVLVFVVIMVLEDVETWQSV